MSEKKNNKPLLKTLFIILGICLVLLCGYMIIHTISNNTASEKLLDMENNDNINTLKRLNEEWIIPNRYSIKDVYISDLRAEWLTKDEEEPQRVILQLHGGAYTKSLSENGATYRRSAAHYAQLANAAVLTPDYRVAPKNPYPAALDDTVAAYNWLLEQGYSEKSIIVAGDSAGGGLTLALCLYLRDNDLPMPAALITMSAWTDLDYPRYTPAYAKGSDKKDPYISPVYGDYSGFPPMLMQVGGDEAILNDTLKVAQEAKNAGVSITQTTYPKMFHVFQMLFPVLDEANEAWQELESFINNIYPD